MNIVDNYISLTNIEKREYKIKLMSDGKSICIGELCKGKIKQLTEFPFSKIGRYDRCNQCNNHMTKKSHINNDYAYRREKNKIKFNKACGMCGNDDIEILEFDHTGIGIEEKMMTIGRSQSATKIKNEIRKTQILCLWCHRLKSRKQSDDLRKDINDYKYTFEEEREKIDLNNSKSCSGQLCNGRIRNLSKFCWTGSKYTHHCKKCITYETKIKRVNAGKFIDKIKSEIGECKLCNKKVTDDTFCCFDFDHLDQKNKQHTISSLRARGASEEIIKMEIEKCQLLCCICHKKKTIKQLNFKLIDNDYIEKYEDTGRKEKQIFMCQLCNKCIKGKNSEYCVDCYLLDKKRRKVTRPSFENLEDQIFKKGFLQTGKDYGVSDNTIRKWIKYYVKYENKQLTKIKMNVN